MMAGKGDKRRPEATSGAYRRNFSRAFPDNPVECPGCAEIELRPTGQVAMWECKNCGLVEQRTC